MLVLFCAGCAAGNVWHGRRDSSVRRSNLKASSGPLPLVGPHTCTRVLEYSSIVSVVLFIVLILEYSSTRVLHLSTYHFVLVKGNDHIIKLRVFHILKLRVFKYYSSTTRVDDTDWFKRVNLECISVHQELTHLHTRATHGFTIFTKISRVSLLVACKTLWYGPLGGRHWWWATACIELVVSPLARF